MYDFYVQPLLTGPTGGMDNHKDWNELKEV